MPEFRLLPFRRPQFRLVYRADLAAGLAAVRAEYLGHVAALERTVRGWGDRVARLEPRVGDLEALPARVDDLEVQAAEFARQGIALDQRIAALDGERPVLTRLDRLEQECAELRRHIDALDTTCQRLGNLLAQQPAPRGPEAPGA